MAKSYWVRKPPFMTGAGESLSLHCEGLGFWFFSLKDEK
jgi:hypothetical protein